MKMFDWLFGSVKTIENEVLELTESMKVKEKVGGFVDDVTGKVYKTAGALKGAQTRRQNKKASAKSKK